jgi:hypothetical protein
MEVIICQIEQSRYVLDAKTVVVAFYAEVDCVVKTIAT